MADLISRIYDLLCAGAGSFEVINRRFGNCYSPGENAAPGHLVKIQHNKTEDLNH